MLKNLGLHTFNCLDNFNPHRTTSQKEPVSETPSCSLWLWLCLLVFEAVAISFFCFMQSFFPFVFPGLRHPPRIQIFSTFPVWLTTVRRLRLSLFWVNIQVWLKWHVIPSIRLAQPHTVVPVQLEHILSTWLPRCFLEKAQSIQHWSRPWFSLSTSFGLFTPLRWPSTKKQDQSQTPWDIPPPHLNLAPYPLNMPLLYWILSPTNQCYSITERTPPEHATPQRSI